MSKYVVSTVQEDTLKNLKTELPCNPAIPLTTGHAAAAAAVSLQSCPTL